MFVGPLHEAPLLLQPVGIVGTRDVSVEGLRMEKAAGKNPP